MTSLPGYDAWKTQVPRWWDWDDGEEDALAEAQYLFELEEMIFPPSWGNWERQPFAGPDELPDYGQLEHMAWDPWSTTENESKS
jgi:hypothetical protein